MQTQIDLGNLAVGIGTAAIAVVTFWVARTNLFLTRKQKIADFRMQWMSELRNTFTDLYRAHYELALVKKDIASPKNKDRKEGLINKRRSLFLEIGAYRVHILTMLKQDSEDADERKLEQLLKKIVSGDLEEAKDQRKEMRELTRAILHKTWKKIRTDIEG